MSVEAVGLEWDFDEIGYSTSPWGSIDGKPVREVGQGVWFDDQIIEKVSGAYFSQSHHLGTEIWLAANTSPNREKTGGIGLSAEAKKEPNGNSKAQIDVHLDKKTDGGANVSIEAGVGVQKDAKGKVSNDQHVKVDLYYSF